MHGNKYSHISVHQQGTVLFVWQVGVNKKFIQAWNNALFLVKKLSRSDSVEVVHLPDCSHNLMGLLSRCCGSPNLSKEITVEANLLQPIHYYLVSYNRKDEVYKSLMRKRW